MAKVNRYRLPPGSRVLVDVSNGFVDLEVVISSRAEAKQLILTLPDTTSVTGNSSESERSETERQAHTRGSAVINSEPREEVYKGFPLEAVKITKKELDDLEAKIGVGPLRYQLESLELYAKEKPRKFISLKHHASTVRNWHRMRIEDGKVFMHTHPQGPGYYRQRDVDNLKTEQLKIR